MMRHWREEAFEKQITPATQRWGIRAWGWLARHPALYRQAWNLGNQAMRLMSRKRGRINSLPLASGWTDWRDMPAPSQKTFMQAYKAQRQEH